MQVFNNHIVVKNIFKKRKSRVQLSSPLQSIATH